MADSEPHDGLIRRAFAGLLPGLAVAVVPGCASFGGESTAEPVVRCLSDGSKLSVEVQGPLPVNHAVLIPGAEADFMDVHDVELVRKTSSARLQVRFSFAGPEHPQRRIRLDLSAKDAGGGVIARISRDTTDQRPAARRPVMAGSRPAQASPRNVENLPLEQDSVLEVNRIELRFVDLLVPQ